jgi:hypothetical protein
MAAPPINGTTPATERQAAARRAYLDSVDAGAPLSGAEIGAASIGPPSKSGPVAASDFHVQVAASFGVLFRTTGRREVAASPRSGRRRSGASEPARRRRRAPQTWAAATAAAA